MTSITQSTPVIDSVERSLALLDETNGRRLIALAGLPGSGKSTLATQITHDVNEQAGYNAMLAVGMDGFHLTKAQLASMPDPVEAIRRRGAPWTFDPNGFYSALTKIKSSSGTEPTYWPAFEHGTGDPVPNAIEIHPGIRLIVVEGLYVLYTGPGWEEIPLLFDERWFLNTSMSVSLDRLARRHMLTRRISRIDADRRIAENDALNAQLVQETCGAADFGVASRIQRR